MKMDSFDEPNCLRIFLDVFTHVETAKEKMKQSFQDFEANINAFKLSLVDRNKSIEVDSKAPPLCEVTNKIEGDIKRACRTKKASTNNKKSTRTKVRNGIKLEPKSSMEKENDNSQFEISKQSTITVSAPPPPIKQECQSKYSMDMEKNINDSVQIVQTKSILTIELSEDENTFVAPKAPAKKATKQKNPVNIASNIELNVPDAVTKLIKTEIQPLNDRMTRSKKRNGNSTDKNHSVSAKTQKTNSMESIYEDAESCTDFPNALDKVYRAKISLKQLDKKTIENYACLQQNVATLAPINTYVIEKQQPLPVKNVINSDITFNVASNVVEENVAINNQTITIKKIIPVCESNNNYNNSLLTDDESIETAAPEPLKKPVVISKKKKELFNPCVDSPLKKKIAAFEKHALEVEQSPIIHRTRTKTRQNVEQNDSDLSTKLPKAITPIAEHRNLPTPLGFDSTGKKLPSATKLAHLKKSSNVLKIPRDPSTEGKRREQKTSLVDEKKKKNEEKMRQVQQTREAIEKEKLDKYKKIVQEKEKQQEEFRRKMAQRKMLEEMNKNIKLIEQKREEQKREQQKKMEKELNNAQRMERENIEKLRAREDKMKAEKIQDNGATTSAVQKSTHFNKFDFHHISSDDSTDDESKCSKKRLIPAWSLAKNRLVNIEKQSYLSLAMLDTLFSVQPSTPNLQEIFPTIDPRNLHRNSSAFWNTPPRYSTMPKY